MLIVQHLPCFQLIRGKSYKVFYMMQRDILINKSTKKSIKSWRVVQQSTHANCRHFSISRSRWRRSYIRFCKPKLVTPMLFRASAVLSRCAVAEAFEARFIAFNLVIKGPDWGVLGLGARDRLRSWDRIGSVVSIKETVCALIIVQVSLNKSFGQDLEVGCATGGGCSV